MKIYVGNLSRQVTDAQLNELATPFGKPLSANVATERSSGESKGFGFIEYGSDDEARAAITGLNGRDVNGQALEVDEARPRKTARRLASERITAREDEPRPGPSCSTSASPGCSTLEMQA